uniref:Aminotransferase-like plant mobile domain-containing protein n=1 Tax=Fagus sylvatica TaxID=28930 RepID=A0A2N9GD00_FAGSY
MSDFDVLGTVEKLALPTFVRFRICGNPSLGSRDMVPRTEATGVFLVHLRAVFRSGFRLDPVKSRRSESSLSCMNVSSFQRTRACRSTCCESGRLCAQAWQRRWENSGTFSKTLFRRPVFTRVVDVAPDVGFRRSWYRRKAYATYFSKGAVSSIQLFGLVNGPVKPWSNLVNLGHFGQSPPNSGEMGPGLHFEGFWARWVLVGSETARSNLGQTLVKLGQTWSTLVKLGQTSGNMSRTFFLELFDVASPCRIRSARFGLSRFACRHPRKSRGTPIDDQFSPTRPTGDHPSLKSGNVTVWILRSEHVGDDLAWVTTQVSSWMSGQGSGSGGPRRSDRLAKGKAVLYEPESPPDTDDEYDAMEDVRTRVDASIARNLQAELDAEAAGLASSTVRPSSRPGITIGRSARPSSAPRQPAAAPTAAPPAISKRQRSDRAPLSADPIPEDYAAPGFRYPPQGGIRPRYPVTTPVADTPLLTGLHSHPSSSVRRCERALARGGWSEFCQLLEIARPEYRDFLVELGFGPFLTPARWGCSLSTGVPFGAFALGVGLPPSDPVPDFEALEILGIDDPAAIVAASLGNDKSTIPTPIVGMFRDIDDLRDYDWGALTYGFYIRGLRRYSRRQTASFLGFWQFTLFWAFEHFAVFAPSRLPAAPDSVFPLARRWDSAWIQRLTIRTLTDCRTTVDCIRDADIVFQPYSTFLLERPEVFRAVELSRLRIWIRSPRSWELLMGERSLRQLGGEALVPVDPPQLMTIEDYIPRAPSDSYVAGVEAYPDLIRADVPYREWFEQVSLGPLMSLHEVEGGQVMGGLAMDSYLFQSSGEFERLQNEILHLQLELSVCEDRHAADMDRAQGETARVQAELTRVQGEMVQMQAALTQSQRDLGFSRCGAGCSCDDHSEIRRISFMVWALLLLLELARPVSVRLLLRHLLILFLDTGSSTTLLLYDSFGSMASSSNDPDSLVTLRFHDFRIERMRHWWTLLGEDDHADIVGIFGKFPPFMRLQVDHGLLEALASFWDPTHCCFSIGEVDLVPTLEEYAELLQLDSPFSETPVIPIQGPRSNRCLEKYLGLTTAVLRPEITRPEETWRKANISLDLLTKYFSRSDFPVELARDFIAGKKGWKKFRNQCLQDRLRRAGLSSLPYCARPCGLCLTAGDRERGFRCSAHSSSSFGSAVTCRHFYRLQTPHHFERHTVSQTVKIALPFTGNSRAWALYLLDLPLSGWAWKVTWGPAAWMPWTHCALFDGVPLPGVWGCTGYYPSLALRQFGGVQYPPRLGDLDAVTFDYIPGEDMWRLLFRIEDIWGGRLSEMVLIEEGSPEDSSVTSDFVEWREGWTPFFYSQAYCTARCIIFFGVSLSSGISFFRASEREESAARVESMRSTLHHNSVAVANLAATWREGNVSTLRTMNDFIREQLEISEAAKDHMEETLTETQGQLETEQVERTRVQDELDSLRSYTQALVDPATGRPHDIVALRRALDESEAALTSARTSIGAMRVQISVLQGDNGVLQTELDLVHDALESDASWLNQEGFPVVTALHQINQVMDSLGARARAVLEEHDEGDPALSTALGRFCRETCIRLGR